MLAVGLQVQGDGHDAPGGGLVDGGHVAGHVDRGDAAREHLLGRVLQGDRVVEVDGVEQALNDRVVVVDGRTQGRVDRGPGGAEQGVGRPGGQLVVGGQGSARGLGVVEAQGGGQREGVVGLAEDGLGRGHHDGQRIHGVAGNGHGGHAGGGREHRVHVLGQLGLIDDGDRAVFAGQNQREDQLAHRVLLGAARVVIPRRVQVDDHVHAGVGRVQGDALLIEDGGRVGHEVTGPRDEGDLTQPFLSGRGGLAVAQARGDGRRDGAGVSQALRGGGLEATQQGGDGLVDAVDAGNGHRAGDDTDLVGAVALVLGLPQAVLAPPADQVVVQDRDEGHRLGVGAAQGREPGGVDRGDVRGRGVRVGGHQAVGGGVSVGDVLDGREQGLNLAVVHGGQACLDALEEVVVADLPRGVYPRVGQVGEATDPGLVGHFFEVAEVGLSRVGEDLDDLVLAGAHLGAVGADLGDDARGGGRRVRNLVHVGAQVGQARRHAAAGHALADPAAEIVVIGHAGRGDEELLDGLGGVRFLRGHRGGTHEDAVHGHGRAAVAGRPVAGQEVGGALGGSDATAHGQDDVGLGAQLRVGGQQQVGQVLPGVVAAGVAVLNLDDDLDRVGLAGDRNHLADLVDRAGLEGHVGEAVGAQLLDEGQGLVLLGDARGDDDAIDGGAGRARTRHDAGLAELKVPQVAVQEHGVELGGVAGAQLGAQARQVLVVDLFGHLAAARHLGPEAGVRGCGDDLGIDGRGGHAGQQDGGAARQAREGGVHDGLAVGQGHEAGAQVRPVGAGLGGPSGGRGLVAVRSGSGGHDTNAGALHEGAGHAHRGRARAHVDDPRGARVGCGADLRRPINGGRQDGGGQAVSQLGVNAALGGPLVHEGEGVGEHGGVEGHVDRQVLAHGGQRATAALVRVVRGLVLGGSALDGCHQGRQVVRGTRHDVRVRVVTQSDRQRMGRRGQGVHDAGQQRVGHAAHRHHVGRVPGVRGARTARHAGGGRTDQASEREHGRSPGLVPVDPGASDLHAENTLRVALERGWLVRHDIEARARQVDERAQLGGHDTRNRQCGLIRTGNLAGHGHLTVGRGQGEGKNRHGLSGQRAAHGGEHLVRCLDDARDDRGNLGVVGNLVERSAPRGRLTGEGQRVGGLIQRGHKRHVHSFDRGQYFSNDTGHRGPLS